MEKIRTAFLRCGLWLAVVGGFPVSGAAQESPHGEMSIPCESCHTSETWKEVRSPMAFDHGTTAFPLAGRHEAVSCRTCHSTLKFRDASTQCRDCHTDVHRGELGTTCERCHTPQSWLIPDMPERHSQTRFPLLGAHRATSCRDCHVSQERNQYRGVPTDCYACHRQQYEATLSPAHAQAGFGTDCVVCHAVDGLHWGGNFNHASTGFPLTGAHAAVACASCHRTNSFKGTPAECIQCHQDDFNATKNPAHVPAGFSTACVTCHSMASWRPATFDHNATAFPLTGAHAGVACNECHKNNQYKGTPTQCNQCHSGDFTAATNPAHVSGGFPTTCVSCHTTLAWRPASFDHNKSAFPLTGAHVAVACVTCHKNNQFTGTPGDCYQCHQSAFVATTSPAHVAGGFPTACVTCHTTTAWAPASFNHSATAFPLTGAHVAVACNTCHVNNVFKGIPTQCNSCHQQDYAASLNPPHASQGFPTDCQTCHSTTAWRPSTFQHDGYFPISSASNHAPGRWSACADCHNVPGNFKAFSCTNCHAHIQSTMDPKHTGVSNYQFNSQACYQCHPRGSQQ